MGSLSLLEEAEKEIEEERVEIEEQQEKLESLQGTITDLESYAESCNKRVERLEHLFEHQSE